MFLLLAVAACQQYQLAHAQLLGEVCSICPKDLPVVGSPDIILPAGTAGILTEDQTCAVTEEQAQAGEFTPTECVLIRATGVGLLCGCEAGVAPTEPPTPEPTDAPAAADTEAPAAAPTNAPVAAATEAPVVAATEAPVVAATEAPVAATSDAPVAATTEAPVAAPTDAPVASTTAPTTSAPLAATTMAPTTIAPISAITYSPAPATLPPVGTNVTTVEGIITIRLETVTGPLSGSSQSHFENITEALFTESLVDWSNFLSSVNNQVFDPDNAAAEPTVRTRHHVRRSLQEGNPLDVQVVVTAETEDASVDPVAFTQLLQETINNSSDLFVSLLKADGDADSQAFFATVETASASTDSTPSPAAAVTTAPVEAPIAPVAAPAAAPAAPVAPAAAAAAPSAEREPEDDGLSTGAIISIVIAVVAAVVGLGAIGYYVTKGSGSAAPASAPTASSDLMAGPRPTTRVKQVGGGASVASSTANPAAVAAVAAIAAGAGSMVGSSNDPSGIKKAAISKIGGEAASTDVEGEEGMSYTYSLDAGNMDQASAAAGRKSAADSGHDATSQSGDEMSSHAMSSLRQNMVSRTVIAPPGKLGIVIDTTLEGPVVHKINAQSPLEGILFPGDIIVAIDDVDTRAMSASAITALMVRTANLRRKLTVLSEDVTN